MGLGKAVISSAERKKEVYGKDKEAGANIQIKKKVIVDLDILEKYIEEKCREEGAENV